MHEEERERERRKEHLHFIPRGFFFERRIPLTLKGTSRGSSSSSSRISPSSRMKLRNAILKSLPFEILILSVEIVLRRQIFPFSLSLSLVPKFLPPSLASPQSWRYQCFCLSKFFFFKYESMAGTCLFLISQCISDLSCQDLSLLIVF